MYRSKSSVSLRSLANSLKHSINFDKNKAQSRQFIPLRSSSSTVNLANYKNHTKKMNFDEEYLIMLETRKSRFGSKSKADHESNITDLSYNLKLTKQLIQKKQKLLQMTKCQEIPTLDMPWHSNVLPVTKKQQDQTILTLQLLEKQYSKMKQNLQKNLSIPNFKSYNKLLEQSDNLTKELKQITEKENEFIEHEKQIQNRIFFIGQEICSIEMNFTEDLAEKQYCEQFLYQYEHAQENHFKQQALNVIKMISLEAETKKIEQEKQQLQKNLQKLQKDFKEWKIEENLQLKQRRFQNKFKENRIQLMKIQQHIDHITQEIINNLSQSTTYDHSIRKVRQYICSYFKKYNQMNINHISHGQIADGIDIFLCKEGLINDFTQFLKEKTQKVSIINGTYSLKLTQYCDCLKKIQNLYLAQKNEINTVLRKKFQQKIICMKQQIENLGINKQKNLSQLKNLQQNIEVILAQQSLSMIQLINKGQNSQSLYNKKQGFFNLQQIKSKVKGMKLEQIKRINRVKEIYFRLKKLQQKQIKYAQLNQQKIDNLLTQKQFLKKEILIWKKKITQIQSIKKGYESKKIKCDQLIDEEITKMKQKDQAQKTLKALQSQIQKIKKQKIQSIKQRHMQNKSPDILGGLRNKMNKNESLSRINFFDQTKKILSRNILSDRLKGNLKIDTLKSSSNRIEESSDLKVSAQFCIAKNEDTNFNDEKMSNKTQSSPKSSKERISLGALNSILLSKCNLVESKNIIQNKKGPLKKSDSVFGILTQKKQNQLLYKQSLRKLTQNSARSSKKSNKQNISRKTSILKNMQRSTIKYGQKRATPVKLSLDSNKKKQTMKIERIYSNNFSKSKPKVSQNKASKKDINTIISNKLLRR